MIVNQLPSPRLHRPEFTLISIFLIVAIPLTLGLMALAGIAALYMSHILPIPESTIKLAALAGFGMGLIATLFELGRLARRFYRLSYWLAAPLFLFWSAVAIAVCMGVPIGLLALGSLAGLYVGRRAWHARAEPAAFTRNARYAACFTATVVGLIMLAMGLLAIRDQHTMHTLLAYAGLGPFAETAQQRTIFVSVAVPALALIQYVLTRFAAKAGFSMTSEMV